MDEPLSNLDAKLRVAMRGDDPWATGLPCLAMGSPKCPLPQGNCPPDGDVIRTQ